LKQTIETLEEYGKYSNNLIQNIKLNKSLTTVEETLHKNKKMNVINVNVNLR